MYVFLYGCHCKYHNELCYKALISGMVVMLVCFQWDVHCKYCNEPSYKAPWAVCLLFGGLVGRRCH